jgi:hypothetical protein
VVSTDARFELLELSTCLLGFMLVNEKKEMVRLSLL